MQFKVGDRVEAIKPPNGVEESQADQIGFGKLLSINPAEENGETHEVRLDSGEEWWYSEDRLRHAVEEIEIHPNPSITVGTQVRLTGVVEATDADGSASVLLKGAEFATNIEAREMKHAEVIRQPFKRGEVVWDNENGQEYVITGDEDSEGRLWAVLAERSATAVKVHSSLFERRPC